MTFTLTCRVDSNERQVPMWLRRVIFGHLLEYSCGLRYQRRRDRTVEHSGEPFLIGPGTIHVAHTLEERVPKKQLLEAVEIYQQMVRQLCKRESK